MQIYKTRLEQLGAELEIVEHVYPSRLTLLYVIPNLRAKSQLGRNVMLSFDDDIGGALQKVCDNFM